MALRLNVAPFTSSFCSRPVGFVGRQKFQKSENQGVKVSLVSTKIVVFDRTEIAVIGTNALSQSSSKPVNSPK